MIHQISAMFLYSPSEPWLALNFIFSICLLALSFRLRIPQRIDMRWWTWALILASCPAQFFLGLRFYTHGYSLTVEQPWLAGFTLYLCFFFMTWTHPKLRLQAALLAWPLVFFLTVFADAAAGLHYQSSIVGIGGVGLLDGVNLYPFWATVCLLTASLQGYLPLPRIIQILRQGARSLCSFFKSGANSHA
ncbi:MAG: hypothetical protein ACYCS1_09250 [Gammaproteobacteria bacterium]